MRRQALAAAFSLLPAVAAAQLVDATDPRQVAALVQEGGYRATLTTDNTGDPMIESALDGTEFVIQFFGCTANTDCRYIVFRAGFLGGGTLERMNAWNGDQLVGTAYLDGDGDPAIDYFVTLEGGVSRENLLDAIDWWQVALTKFKQHIQ